MSTKLSKSTYKYEFSVFSFSGSRFARNDQTLVDTFCLKTFVGGFSQSKNMRRQNAQLLTMVAKHATLQKENFVSGQMTFFILAESIFVIIGP